MGIPTAHIATVTPISKSVGAVRIVGAVAIPYPVGQPGEGKDKEDTLRENIVDKALHSLTELNKE